jgi:hybrid cluster-associated redox disulfide protein
MRDYRNVPVTDSKKKRERASGGAATKHADSASASAGPIEKTMLVSQIIELCPEAATIVPEYGLHCFSCSASALETLEEGCLGHGFSESEIDELVSDLNEIVLRRPARPGILTITPAAARAVRPVLEEEGKLGHGLAVIADGQGGFCMEVREKARDDDRIFTSVEEPEIRFFASPLTLAHIGGSRVDYREGRFKLDLPEDAAHACACGGKCACKK